MSKQYVCSPDDCTGCGLCLSLCPRSAITLKVSQEFFSEVAVIDDDACIHCGICHQICPQESTAPLYANKKCFAGWLPDSARPVASSSGGVAYALSKYVIDAMHGVVCGCVMDGANPKHVFVENSSELLKLCGSKYVQSDTSAIWLPLAAYLKDDKTVLFCGTPCQVAAARRIAEKIQTGKLLTIDLVCHGTPPRSFLHSYLKEICPTLEYDTMLFRDNYNYNFNFIRKNRIVGKKNFHRNWYELAFMYGLSYRENCYHCHYATAKRVGDLTLGDFWGVDRNILTEIIQYPSVILCNTANGEQLLESASSVVKIERPIAEAIAGNGQLREPSSRHPDRNAFLKDYVPVGFSQAVARTSVKEYYHTIAFIVRNFIARCLRFALRKIGLKNCKISA